MVREGQSFTSTITAYGPPWDSMNGGGTTSTGIKLGGVGTSETKGGYNIAAVDPAAIPYGTTFTIDGMPGTWLAADTGGAFHIGLGKIDTFHTGGHAADNAIGSVKRKVTIITVGRGANDPAIARAKRDKTSAVPAENTGEAQGDALQSGILDVVPGGGVIRSVGDFLAQITSQAFWLRAGKIILGIIMLMMGAVFIGKQFMEPVVKAAAPLAATVAKVAA